MIGGLGSSLHAGIMIYPTYVTLSEEQPLAEVMLMNSHPQETLQYRISLKYAKQNPDGSYTDVGTPDHLTGKDLVRFSPRSATLGPKQSQRIKILLRAPKDTTSGEYTAYVVFTEVPLEKPRQAPKASVAAGVQIELRVIPSFAIPLIVTVGESAPDAVSLAYQGRSENFDEQPAVWVRLTRQRPQARA